MNRTTDPVGGWDLFDSTVTEGKESKPDQAKEWLRVIFASGEPLPSSAVLKIGSAMGFRRNSLFAAKKALGLVARKDSRERGAWFWHPPGSETDGPVAHSDYETEASDDTGT